MSKHFHRILDILNENSDEIKTSFKSGLATPEMIYHGLSPDGIKVGSDPLNHEDSYHLDGIQHIRTRVSDYEDDFEHHLNLTFKNQKTGEHKTLQMPFGGRAHYRGNFGIEELVPGKMYTVHDGYGNRTHTITTLNRKEAVANGTSLSSKDYEGRILHVRPH